ncbi:Gfo/Idh/MocA family protein [Saccharothrix coeruleofusca]|uniref:Gfo/Idh/MocA-like oxidoreductase N-terminal domain-containing protein n=1 Tax=Saccharothrix coeruleofusca TaxID=33919 RepID=A0A918AR90_9PSEU|nr:Gfo/Idh/MocA family oxidoreductase [Saccharothrix coeruleofusca]GGP65184.1 hypothetical protein GCM10010185_42340 [Saccharothrix coeruleofusca]
MDQVRVGLVGLGVIARTHLEVLAERPDVALEFTAAPEGEPLAGVAHHRDLAAALASHEPDLIVIATPTDTHAELAELALTRSGARLLVEKPLVHDLALLERLRALAPERVFTAHHFAFSPEVRWAAEQLRRHPEWGPVTRITSAFHDPYAVLGERAFASYASSWTDSGVNQLSMIARFVELEALTSLREDDGGATSWGTARYRSRGRTGTARLRTSWLAGSSSKETVLVLAESGVELWLDHTALTGFAAREGELLATCDTDGRTPRKIAHYRPLYDSLLSAAPDPVLGFELTERITAVHRARP